VTLSIHSKITTPSWFCPSPSCSFPFYTVLCGFSPGLRRSVRKPASESHGAPDYGPTDRRRDVLTSSVRPALTATGFAPKPVIDPSSTMSCPVSRATPSSFPVFLVVFCAQLAGLQRDGSDFPLRLLLLLRCLLYGDLFCGAGSAWFSLARSTLNPTDPRLRVPTLASCRQWLTNASMF